MNKVDEYRISAIPSSFVFSNMKLVTDTGSGEAKLHIGSLRKGDDFDSFFNNFDPANVYFFKKENMLEYLLKVQIEYVYQKINRYRNAGAAYWHERYNEINDKNSSDFEFRLEKFADSSRYYIRSSNESIFNQSFRKIALPLITNLLIEKFQRDDSVFEYSFKVELNLNYGEAERTPEREVPHAVLATSQIEDTIPRNRIVYGAPGTGKSHFLKEESEKYFSEDCVTRVTFHHDYTYGQFVGSYKPSPIYFRQNTLDGKWFEADGSENTSLMQPSIDYRLIPGPFLTTLSRALKSKKEEDGKNYLLIIEEINRANVSGVFGDVFQLLDRDHEGNSEYSIEFNSDIMKYLIREQAIEPGEKVKLPGNMYIWATMNSADQGVAKMDSAFKRRWSFQYIDIDAGEEEIKGRRIYLPFLQNMGSGWNQNIPMEERTISWNSFRKLLNNRLIVNNVTEDKLIGPFFLTPAELRSETEIQNKLLLYLRDDVLRHNPGILFSGSNFTFSSIVKSFSSKNIFTIPDEEFIRLMAEINSNYAATAGGNA